MAPQAGGGMTSPWAGRASVGRLEVDAGTGPSGGSSCSSFEMHCELQQTDSWRRGEVMGVCAEVEGLSSAHENMVRMELKVHA